MDITQLNRIPFLGFRELFASLNVPEPDSLPGRYRGAFVGPDWVRTAVQPALWVTGLGGWWGKELYKDGRAINILLRRGRFLTRFRMRSIKAQSSIDGREGLSMRYLPDNPILWLFIVDEFRRLDDSTLLGMTRPRIPGLRWLALPFILRKQNRETHFYGESESKIDIRKNKPSAQTESMDCGGFPWAGGNGCLCHSRSGWSETSCQ